MSISILNQRQQLYGKVLVLLRYGNGMTGFYRTYLAPTGMQETVNVCLTPMNIDGWFWEAAELCPSACAFVLNGSYFYLNFGFVG